MTELTEPRTREPYKWAHLSNAYTKLQSELAAGMSRWGPGAACKGNYLFRIDIDYVRGEDRAELTEALRHVCMACPVQPQCLEHALSFPEPSGFWGGYTAEQRKELRKGTR